MCPCSNSMVVVKVDIGECKSNIPRSFGFVNFRSEASSTWWVMRICSGKLHVPGISDQILGKRRKTVYIYKQRWKSIHKKGMFKQM